jgi:hypothetical protein
MFLKHSNPVSSYSVVVFSATVESLNRYIGEPGLEKAHTISQNSRDRLLISLLNNDKTQAEKKIRKFYIHTKTSKKRGRAIENALLGHIRIFLTMT